MKRNQGTEIVIPVTDSVTSGHSYAGALVSPTFSRHGNAQAGKLGIAHLAFRKRSISPTAPIRRQSMSMMKTATSTTSTTISTLMVWAPSTWTLSTSARNWATMW